MHFLLFSSGPQQVEILHPRGYLPMSPDFFFFFQLLQLGECYWQLTDRGRDVAKQLTRHGTASTAKKNPAQNVNGAEPYSVVFIL